MKKYLFYITLSFFTSFTFANSWVEASKITSDSSSEGDWYGKSFDLQNGVLYAGEQSSRRGSVEIREKDSAGVWQTTQTITPPAHASDFTYGIEDFGSFIDVEKDILVIGAAKTDIDQPFAPDAGLVFIYKKSNNNIWELAQYIQSPETITSDDYFGANFAVKDSILVIAKRDYIAKDGAGSAFVYEMNDLGMFEYTQKLEGSGIEHWDVFGRQLAITNGYIIASSDLETQFERQNQSGDVSGGAYFFKKDSSGSWIETQHLLSPTRTLGARFGASLATQDSVVFIGAKRETVSRIVLGAGAVYQYQLNNEGLWVFTAQILPENVQENAEFGSFISVTENRLIISAPRETSVSGDKRGFIYSFLQEANDSFTFETAFSSENSSTSNQFGSLVRVEGNEIFAGPFSPNISRSSGTNTEAGSIFHFTLESSVSLRTASQNEQNQFKIYPNPSSNGLLFIQLSDANDAGIIRVYDLNGKLIASKSCNGLTNTQLDLSLNSGTYLVEFSNQNSRSTEQLIITDK